MEQEIELKGGKKVLVRDLRENDDVIDLARFINEMVEAREYLSIDEIQSPESETAWLQGQMSTIEKGNLIDWRVFLDNKIVGGVEARRGLLRERGNVEFGIALSEEVRGQGLGRKLLELVIAEAKERWQPKNLFICCFGANDRAYRLYTSMGFREFARFPNWVDFYGDYMEKIWLIWPE